MNLLPEPDQRLLSFADNVRVALLIAKFDQCDLVIELADAGVEGAERTLDPLPLTHQSLRALAIVPKVRGFGFAIEDS
jgi:hypothetical protein